MTNRIEIDLSSAVPVVLVDGVRVGCFIDLTFHKEGGLQVENLTIKGIPTEAEIEEAPDA